MVITTKGTVGRVAFVGEDDPEFVYSPQLCYWRSREGAKIVPRWLLYALQSNEVKHQMGWAAGQTDMAPYVSLTDQRNAFFLTVPPISEQTSIAELLGCLDDKIELNRRMNDTLEAMARAIFRDWFVDFGPTRAKAEGRAPYLVPELWDLFPDSLGTEGHPIGWRRKNLGELFNVSIGRTPPRKERHHFVPSGQGRTWLSIKTMGNIQTFATASEEDLNPEAVRLFRIPEVPSGTVLVSFKLTVGRVAIAAKTHALERSHCSSCVTPRNACWQCVCILLHERL